MIARGPFVGTTLFGRRSFVQVPRRICVALYARSLVDPASSHMLVSKIKPCMSQYKPH